MKIKVVHYKGCSEHYEVDVPSPDGLKNYHVILCTGEWHCGCKAFAFRRTCSHLVAAKLIYENLETTIQRRAEGELEQEVNTGAELASKIRSWKLQLERQYDLTSAQKKKIEASIMAASIILGRTV